MDGLITRNLENNKLKDPRVISAQLLFPAFFQTKETLFRSKKDDRMFLTSGSNSL